MRGDMAISVDRDFARFGSKSFAINKINTVEVKARRPHSQNAFFLWGLLALGSLLIFAGGSPTANTADQRAASGSGGTIAGLLLCAFFGFLGYRAWKRSKIVEYQLLLVTSSQAVQALKSEDGSLIESLRDRIERAMAGRPDAE